VLTNIAAAAIAAKIIIATAGRATGDNTPYSPASFTGNPYMKVCLNRQVNFGFEEKLFYLHALSPEALPWPPFRGFDISRESLYAITWQNLLRLMWSC
jgi:hypothetical protein